MKPLLMVLTGLTASGKTDLALTLARKITGRIITADSTQLIRQISVLSNKTEPVNGVDLLGSIDGFKFHSVVGYSNTIFNVVNSISKTQTPILEGGSAYYVRMILNGGLVNF